MPEWLQALMVGSSSATATAGFAALAVRMLLKSNNGKLPEMRRVMAGFLLLFGLTGLIFSALCAGFCMTQHALSPNTSQLVQHAELGPWIGGMTGSSALSLFFAAIARYGW